jgi:hypothetical protein
VTAGHSGLEARYLRASELSTLAHDERSTWSSSAVLPSDCAVEASVCDDGGYDNVGMLANLPHGKRVGAAQLDAWPHMQLPVSRQYVGWSQDVRHTWSCARIRQSAARPPGSSDSSNTIGWDAALRRSRRFMACTSASAMTVQYVAI